MCKHQHPPGPLQTASCTGDRWSILAYCTNLRVYDEGLVRACWNCRDVVRVTVSPPVQLLRYKGVLSFKYMLWMCCFSKAQFLLDCNCLYSTWLYSWLITDSHWASYIKPSMCLYSNVKFLILNMEWLLLTLISDDQQYDRLFHPLSFPSFKHLIFNILNH